MNYRANFLDQHRARREAASYMGGPLSKALKWHVENKVDQQCDKTAAGIDVGKIKTLSKNNNAFDHRVIVHLAGRYRTRNVACRKHFRVVERIISTPFGPKPCDARHRLADTPFFLPLQIAPALQPLQ